LDDGLALAAALSSAGALAGAESVGLGAGSRMWASKVTRSTMAATRRRPGKTLPYSLKGFVEAE